MRNIPGPVAALRLDSKAVSVGQALARLSDSFEWLSLLAERLGNCTEAREALVRHVTGAQRGDHAAHMRF